MRERVPVLVHGAFGVYVRRVHGEVLAYVQFVVLFVGMTNPMGAVFTVMVIR